MLTLGKQAKFAIMALAGTGIAEGNGEARDKITPRTNDFSCINFKLSTPSACAGLR